MSLKEKYVNLGKNIGIFTISNFSVKIITFLVLPLYTYYLSTEQYAVIDLVNTTSQLILPFLTLCIIEAALRFGVSGEYDSKSVFTNSIYLIVLGCILLPFLTQIIKIFVDIGSVEWYFVAIYCLQVFNSMFSAYTKAINKVKEMAIISMVTSISIVLFNVLFVAILQWGMEGYFISMIIGNLIGIILYMTVCKMYRYFSISSFDIKVLKEMLIYAIPLIPNSVFWWINTSLDRYALMAFAGLSVVGLYSVANRVPTIISTVTSIFSQAWNLSAFQVYNDSDKEIFYTKTYLIYRYLLASCTSGVILLSRVFAQILFSKDFYAAWVFIPVLTLGVYYNSLNSFLGSIFTASKQTKHIFYTTAGGAVINIILNVILIPIAGGQGAAVATLVSYLAVWLIRVRTVRKIVEFRIKYYEEFGLFVLLAVESVLVLADSIIGLVLALGITVLICIYSAVSVLKRIKN